MHASLVVGVLGLRKLLLPALLSFFRVRLRAASMGDVSQDAVGDVVVDGRCFLVAPRF